MEANSADYLGNRGRWFLGFLASGPFNSEHRGLEELLIRVLSAHVRLEEAGF